VSIEFDQQVQIDEFERIPGVSELECDASHLEFKVTGPIDPVVKAAARHTIIDMELTEPTLEEIFLTYYTRNRSR
jgi:ABC-2 type transport system ATP-binding protein